MDKIPEFTPTFSILLKKTDEHCSLLTLSLRFAILRSDDCAPVHRGNQIPPEGKTTDEIFLDPVGMDGV